MNRAEIFLQEIKEVCLKHKLSISHEDCHGGFKIEEYNDTDMEWLLDCGEYFYDKNKNDAVHAVEETEGKNG